VTFAEAAVIATHRGLDQTHRVVFGALELVLTETDRHRWFAGAAEGRISTKLAGCFASEVGLGGRIPEMTLNSGTDQQSEFFFVHSTHSS
jgi:hypothetical protein